MLQRNVPDGNGGVEQEFFPYVQVLAHNGYSLSSVEIRHGASRLGGHKIGNIIYETDLDTDMEPDLAYGGVLDVIDLNGAYSIKATSKDGDGNPVSAVGQFNFDFDGETKILGELNVTELKYDGSQIIASWEPVDNATHMGIVICPQVQGDNFSGREYYRAFYDYQHVTTTNLTSNGCAISVNSSTLKDNEEVRVMVVAARLEEGKGSLFLESEPKTIRKGVDHFLEDQAQ